jgi:excinuclease ABC subunit A
MTTTIKIEGARTHNLKNIHLELPRDQLIVVTGLSGSGKSSLVFETIHAEGQRRYVESLPAYARQFLSVMEKPDVDHISGLSPAIAIQQKTISHNPRSTVGTVTEIYDYLRVLFARAGEPHCPDHGLNLAAQTVSQMVDHILSFPEQTRFLLLAPIIQGKKGEHTLLLSELRSQGYLRIRVNGKIIPLSEISSLPRNQRHTIEVVVDRLVQRPEIAPRLTDSITTTLRLSDGLARVAVLSDEGHISQELTFSSRFACPECNYSLQELEPRLFSFNNTLGACPECNGLGIQMIDSAHHAQAIQEPFPFAHTLWHHSTDHDAQFETCHACSGDRLRREARHVFLEGVSLPQLSRLPLNELQAFFSHLELKGQRQKIAEPLLREIGNRVGFLLNVGLEYLSLSRSAETLSGGESQRIRLASQIGSGLVGVMYVLDEPSIGLHPRDNTRLLKTLDHLRNLGNTVIVVEHDEEAIRHADHVVDIGPGAGVHGGHVVAQGTPEAIMQNPESPTGQYLSGKRSIAVPKTRTPVDPSRMLSLKEISENNLKNISVEIPIGLMTCITGVSGSGKSTLINDTLCPRVSHLLNTKKQKNKPSNTVHGIEHLDKIIEIDQKPIGRTPRSNPATYVGLLSPIRELFAATPEARARGYTPGRFSFNVKGGRCEACEGGGLVKVEMHFLADIHVVCDVCKGKRYNRETLEIYYKQKNIHEILEMTIEEAHAFFSAVPAVARRLHTLIEVGLAYLKLGQSATTLSGGEAQRIKLARELARRDTGRTLYILDEPTTGLHFYDIEQLLGVLHRLRQQGNTIVIIEHNLDVIKTADWIIDLGPEGGSKGGEVVCYGTPETVAQHPYSYTGQYLKPLLT